MMLSGEIQYCFIISLLIASVRCLEDGDTDYESVESGAFDYRRLDKHNEISKAFRKDQKKLRKEWMEENATGQAWINVTRDCGNGFHQTEGRYFRLERDLDIFEMICKSSVKLHHPNKFGEPATTASLIVRNARRQHPTHYFKYFYEFNSSHWWWWKQEEFCFKNCDEEEKKSNGTVLTGEPLMRAPRRYYAPFVAHKEDHKEIFIFELNKTQLALDNPSIWFIQRAADVRCPEAEGPMPPTY